MIQMTYEKVRRVVLDLMVMKGIKTMGIPVTSYKEEYDGGLGSDSFMMIT